MSQSFLEKDFLDWVIDQVPELVFGLISRVRSQTAILFLMIEAYGLYSVQI
jgi:hypothetical protein